MVIPGGKDDLRVLLATFAVYAVAFNTADATLPVFVFSGKGDLTEFFFLFAPPPWCRNQPGAFNTAHATLLVFPCFHAVRLLA